MDEKPKYVVLMEHITENIKKSVFLPGNQIPSENELAAQFLVSRHTVRQAIGILEKEGILFRSQGRGTYVTKPDVAKTANSILPQKTVAIITTYLNDYIFPTIIQGMEERLFNEGFSCTLHCTLNRHEKEQSALNALIGQNISGLIVETTRGAVENPNIDLYKKLTEQGVKLLFIHGSYSNYFASSLTQDDNLGGYIACKELINNGHTKICGLFKRQDIQGNHRYKGFLKALEEYGLCDEEQENVIWYEEAVDISPLFSRYSAFVVYNELAAVWVMDQAKAYGLKIPNDISIVTFDDSQIAIASEPKLTTIAHPKIALGRRAADMMIRMIRENIIFGTEKMVPKLIKRDSVRSCSKSFKS